MRFMIMHKMTAEMEKGGRPDQAIIEGVGALIADAKETFVGGEGLKPSSERVHIKYQGGERTITDGPFTEAKELVAGFALMQVRSKEEAIAWTDRFAAAFGDVELFMGPVVEPWDLGFVPKPENPPLRFLAMHQLNECAEHAPDPQRMARMGVLVEEMTKAGVLLATGGLTGTERGARIRFEGKTPTVIDGPFAESKELIAGYAILSLPSREAAIAWGLRFGEVVKVNEVEVREMPEW
jgi:hypothetical protein